MFVSRSRNHAMTSDRTGPTGKNLTRASMLIIASVVVAAGLWLTFYKGTSAAARPAVPASVPAPNAASAPPQSDRGSSADAPLTCLQYTSTLIQGSLVPGTTDTGNHCNDCATQITLPFPFHFYDQTFTSAYVGSNGLLNFTGTTNPATNDCLPYTGFSYVMMAYWDDLHTECSGCGIFTSVSGTAPNRIFNIEWRTNTATNTANFEIRLMESSTSSAFEYRYGGIPEVGSGETVGIQNSQSCNQQIECNSGLVASGEIITWSALLPPSPTPTNTPSNTPTGTPTNTPTNVPTNTPTNTPTRTATNSPTRTPTPAPSNTPGGPTDTPTTIPSNTPTSSPSDTSTASPTSTYTDTPGPTSTACAIHFTDVAPGSAFYAYVRCLACRGIIQGYSNWLFCRANGAEAPCFLPNANVTRAQMAKVISISAGYNDTIPPSRQTFQDIPNTSIFWEYIERVALHGIVNGYPCGGPSEPCVTPENRPYFRPSSNVTTGQVAKMISNSAGYDDDITDQHFIDVAPGSVFFLYIGRVYLHGVVDGYTDPSICISGVPCFRPNNQVTRGQATKFVSNAFFPDCQTPSRENP